MTDTRIDQAWAPGPMIPGERDPSNLTHREPGAISGQFSGGDIPAAASDWLDERTSHERAREGGGPEGESALREHQESGTHDDADRLR